jgi:exopolyphosphatase/guanosine-5'-triphosphate,3'-diphosphate pyrophosphatase
LIAVVDVGSNSVRLVVFAGEGRWSVPVFNERTLCGLGRGLSKNGRLDADAVKIALSHLKRFRELGSAMGVVRWEVLATEAVRAAKDGKSFVAKAEKCLGQPLKILDGDAEAMASANGVLSGIPDAEGFMGDLGGGSLEIVVLDKGKPGARASLPLGPLRFSAKELSDMTLAETRIDEALKKVPWLKDMTGRGFYPVGGAWRALANVHMGHTEYPLHVIHQYELGRRDALDILKLVGRMGPQSLGQIPRVPKARQVTLPIAAKLMERLLVQTKPAKVVFSAHGLREGWLFSGLSKAQRKEDPLLAGCAEYGRREARFGAPGEALADWAAPLFPDDGADWVRLRRAAASLAEVGWRDHPDYRAEDNFSRVLHLPLAGIGHEERVLLAFMVSARYGGGRTGLVKRHMRPLIDSEDLAHAITVGRALRLGLTISGGTHDILSTVSLAMDEKAVTLTFGNGAGHMMSEAAWRRFESLARRLGRKPVVVVG